MDKQNEKITELTKKQMEKVSGGGKTDNQGRGYDPGPIIGTDCFICQGTLVNDKTKTKRCGWSLIPVSGGKYRCNNGNCDLCGKDQYPTVSKH